MAETISHIKIGNQEHPIDAVTINGLTLTSEEKTRWDDKQDALTFDSIPTENSENLVKSGVLYSIITENEEITAAAIVDINQRLVEISNLPAFAITSGSIDYWDNAVQGVTFNGVYVSSSYGEVELSETDPVFAASVAASITASDISSWNAKQDALTFDSIPMASSSNLVRSSGIYDYITDIEYVTVSAINDLNDRVVVLESLEIPDVSDFITNSVSDLANYYLKTETYNKTEVDTLIGNILQFHYEIAASTSAVSSPESNVLYLIGPTGSGSDKYEEYIYPNSTAGWTKIGDTSLDLSGYVTISSLNSTLSNYVTTSALSTALTSYVTTSVLNTTLASYLTSESDPIFSASAAASITASDISSWNAKQDALTFDSIPMASSSNLVRSSGIYDYITDIEYVTAATLNDLNDRMIDVETSVNNMAETDPVFMSSAASVITTSDISNWNNKLSSVTINGVSASVSNGEASLSVPIDIAIVRVSGNTSASSFPSGTFDAINDAYKAGKSVVLRTFDGEYDFDYNCIVAVSDDAYTFYNENDNTVLQIFSDDTISADYGFYIRSNSPAGSITASDISSWNAKQDALTFDSIPTENSENLVKSGVLYSVITENEMATAGAINDLNNRLNTLSSSISSVSSVLVFDSEPTENSDNLVKSGGIHNYITEIEEATAYAINDLNTRLETIEESPAASITSSNISSWNNKLTGVTVNGVSASVSNGVASISVSIPAAVTASTVASWGFLTSESDPVFASSVAASITAANISAWNAKQNALTYDSIPTYNSDNLVKSGVLYSIFEENEYVVSTALNDLNTRVSTLESNQSSGGGISNESDPVFASSVAATISAADITNWNSHGNAKIFYGTCSTAADTAAKTVDCSVFTSADLVNGALIFVTFSATNSASAANLTMDVNSTGEKSIKKQYTAAISNITANGELRANQTYLFAYDGTNWVCQTLDYNTNTNTYQRLYVTTGDVEYPITTRYATTSGSSYYAEYGRYSESVTLNPSTNTITASGFKVAGGTSSQFLKADGTLDSNTYLTTFTESDPVFASSVAASISAADITNWNSKTSNTGTVTGSSLTADKIIAGNSGTSIKATSYTITQRIPSSGGDTQIPTYTVVSDAINTALTSVLKYKGTIGTGGTVTSLPAIHAVGDVYVVCTAGTYSTKICEVGDYIICKTAGTSANDSHWDVVNGENQVDNKGASLAAAGSSATIATIDGTDITISTPASWTGVDKVGTLTGITFNGSAATVSNGIVTISESDPVFSASAAAGISAADITNWNSKTSNTGTITGISMNGASKGTSGNVNLGTVVTAISFNGTAATISNGVASISAAVLPSVSSADSGKILQVNSNGSWALVTPVSIYNGSSAPNNANGNNGDIYIQTS